MVWVLYYVVPVAVGIVVLALCGYRVIAEVLVLRRQVSAAQSKLTAAGATPAAGTGEPRPSGDGAGGLLAARGAAGTRGR